MFVLLAAEMLIHFLFEHVLNGISEKILDCILEIGRCLDIVHPNEIAEELTLLRAHLGTALPSRLLRLL